MGIIAFFSNSLLTLLLIPTVNAPDLFASLITSTVNFVEPLAANPITTSIGLIIFLTIS